MPPLQGTTGVVMMCSSVITFVGALPLISWTDVDELLLLKSQKPTFAVDPNHSSSLASERLVTP